MPSSRSSEVIAGTQLFLLVKVFVDRKRRAQHGYRQQILYRNKGDEQKADDKERNKRRLHHNLEQQAKTNGEVEGSANGWVPALK